MKKTEEIYYSVTLDELKKALGIKEDLWIVTQTTNKDEVRIFVKEDKK